MASSFDPQLLNRLFGWQVAKKVRHLAPTAILENFIIQDDSASGVILASGKKQNCSFRMLSPTLLEGKCSCPVYRHEASLCEHIGLLYWHACGNALGGSNARDKKGTSATEAGEYAYSIQFPANWIALWEKTTFPVRCEVLSGQSPSASDKAFSEWLLDQGVSPANPPKTLGIPRGKVRKDFLNALTGHKETRYGEKVFFIDGSSPLIPLKMELRDSNWLLSPVIPGNYVSVEEYYWNEETGELFPKPCGESPCGMGKDMWERLLAGGKELLSGKKLISVINRLQEYFEIIDAADLPLPLVKIPRPDFHFRWEGSHDFLRATVFAVYGEMEKDFPLIPGEAQFESFFETGPDPSPGYWRRNRACELEVGNLLQGHGFVFTPRGWMLSGQERVEEFWTMDLPAWKKRPDMRHEIDNDLKHDLKSLDRLIPELIYRDGRNQGWLEAEFVFTDSAGAHYPSTEVLKMIKAGKKRMELPGGRTGRFDLQAAQDWSQVMEESELSQISPGRFRISGKYVPAFSAMMNGEPCTHDDRKPEWEKIRQKIIQECRFVLRPYQEEGVEWMWNRLLDGGGALLGDDMGLGKTLQTLALIVALRESIPDFASRPSLLVVPASLLDNWKEEAERAFPGLNVTVLYGQGREERKVADLGITTYALLTRDFARHRQAGYAFIGFDEASFVRNPDTDAADSLRRIPADFKLALTGTPIENSVRDLWSIFEIVLPGYLGSRKGFRTKYEQPIASCPPDMDALRRLRYRTAPWILRRTKEDVAPELPPKIVSVRWCELAPAHKTLYQTILREGDAHIRETVKKKGREAARMVMLTTLLRLRQLCNDSRLLPLKHAGHQASAKLESFREMIRESLDNGRKVLVFSQFSSMLSLLKKELDDMETEALILDGSVRDRGALIREFNRAGGPPVFLISLKAGGYGLNLQTADTVIHFDPWWNPAVEAQATDRAYRIGQARTVNVYKMICKGTVEEKILELQKRKQGYLAAALGEDGSGLGGLDDSELRELLSM